MKFIGGALTTRKLQEFNGTVIIPFLPLSLFFGCCNRKSNVVRPPFSIFNYYGFDLTHKSSRSRTNLPRMQLHWLNFCQLERRQSAKPHNCALFAANKIDTQNMINTFVQYCALFGYSILYDELIVGRLRRLLCSSMFSTSKQQTTGEEFLAFFVHFQWIFGVTDWSVRWAALT